MRIKLEKTASGKVKAVVLKRRKVNYGTVEVEPEKFKNEGEYTAPKKSEEPPIDPKMTHSGGASSGEESGMPEQEQDYPEPYEASVGESSENESEDSTETISYTEALKQQIEKQAEAEEEAKKEKPFNMQEAINSLLKSMRDDLGEKKEDSSKKKPSGKSKDDLLTEYLVMNLRLRALSEILGAVKVAKEGKTYHSFIAIEAVGIKVFETSPAKEGIILDFDTFPYFESREQAEAFLELCHPVINRFCHLMSHLNPVAITQSENIEVIH